jgi:hypothetical protein
LICIFLSFFLLSSSSSSPPPPPHIPSTGPCRLHIWRDQIASS